jgi:glycosyltransferase involved in cell wall biosynthesis
MLPCCKRDLVSIIVPTFNSAKTLESCLKSIRKQTYAFLEVLVVDNFSFDGTQALAESYGAQVLPHYGTTASARNVGLMNSNGAYVLFLDSDQQLESQVIEDCVSACVHERVQAVKIPEVFFGAGFWGRSSAFWKNKVVAVSGVEGGLPRFYERAVLVKFSAFNSRLRYWEDQELYQRLKNVGVKSAWCPHHVFHEESGSLIALTRKYLFYGKSITLFHENALEAPYLLAAKITVFAFLELIRRPGRSVKLFLGSLFLFGVKSCCAALGFLMNQRFPLSDGA